MNKINRMAAAASPLMSAALPSASIAAVAPVKRMGINRYKGQSKCNTAQSACAGQKSCKGKGGLPAAAEKACTDKGGSVIKG